MDGSKPVPIAWRPCDDCDTHRGFDPFVFGNPSGGRPQSLNRRAHEASGCRLWAADVDAQPNGVGGDRPTGLSSPEIAKLRDQQAQRQPSLGTFPAPEVGERKLEPAAQTPDRRANGTEGISRGCRKQPNLLARLRMGRAHPARSSASRACLCATGRRQSCHRA
jgi:hypothetical protein